MCIHARKKQGHNSELWLASTGLYYVFQCVEAAVMCTVQELELIQFWTTKAVLEINHLQGLRKL